MLQLPHCDHYIPESGDVYHQTLEYSTTWLPWWVYHRSFVSKRRDSLHLELYEDLQRYWVKISSRNHTSTGCYPWETNPRITKPR